MNSACCLRPLTLKVLRVRLCVFLSAVCLACWPLSSEAARLRCGSDLLSDLLFVCGERGIYLGKGSWSGYGARPIGKGIVDQCCRLGGCELHHLEMYCAKPKNTQPSTAQPTTTATTTISTTTISTTISTTTTQSPTTTTTSGPSTTHPDPAQQFQAVFQRRLMEHLGGPGSPKREAYRRRTQPSPRRKNKASVSRRKTSTQNTTSRPASQRRRGLGS